MTERFFCHAGPVSYLDHYHVNFLKRKSVKNIATLIGQKSYFVLYAPRQSGKTTTLLALMHHINTTGNYRCVYANVESGQLARDSVEDAMHIILGELSSRALLYLQDDWPSKTWADLFKNTDPNRVLTEFLTQWSLRDSRPLVLFIDEIDIFTGDSLLSILRQIRTGYDRRPTGFPQSIVLCGVHDVRDYHVYSNKTHKDIKVGSAYNINAKSLRLEHFDRSEVFELLQQYTKNTGQAITKDAIEQIFELTQGQPWIVNAIMYSIVSDRLDADADANIITIDVVNSAKEKIIRHQDLHFDILTSKLTETRVHDVIVPILASNNKPIRLSKDDVHYVEQLGLVTTKGQLRIANPIYQLIIPRELIYTTSLSIYQEATLYTHSGGMLNIPKLLTVFRIFFRDFYPSWVEDFQYKEVGPQLLTLAFLNRIISDNGTIEFLYGIGRMCTNIIMYWPYPQGVQKVVLELRMIDNWGVEKALTKGGEHLAEFSKSISGTESHLLIFDFISNKKSEDKMFSLKKTVNGVALNIWGI